MPREAALLRILYVEDEADIRAIASAALSLIGGYDVHSCASGAQALADVPAFLPDLVLMDVMMPVMDGLATLVSLRAVPELASVPCILMTARIQQSQLTDYGDLGVLGVIAKPFEPLKLPQQVLHMWETGG